MTKLRAPLSIDAALSRIAGQLPEAWDEMARIAQRHVRTVRNWGDPDKDEGVPLEIAIKLDLAYLQAGGTGYPLLQAYAHQLELAEASAFANEHELLRQVQVVAKESGEATAAMIGAAQPSASKADRARALVEATEAREALDKVIPMLAADVEPP